jgi:hypothetical protein
VWFHVSRAVHFLLFLDPISEGSCVGRGESGDKIDKSAKEDISVCWNKLWYEGEFLRLGLATVATISLYSYIAGRRTDAWLSLLTSSAGDTTYSI